MVSSLIIPPLYAPELYKPPTCVCEAKTGRKGVCRRGGGIKLPLGAIELDREIDYTDDDSRNRNLIMVSRVNELFIPAFGKLTDVIRVERKLIRKDSGELREHIVLLYSAFTLPCSLE
jgi:hypothetical protein